MYIVFEFKDPTDCLSSSWCYFWSNINASRCLCCADTHGTEQQQQRKDAKEITYLT